MDKKEMLSARSVYRPRATLQNHCLKNPIHPYVSLWRIGRRFDAECLRKSDGKCRDGCRGLLHSKGKVAPVKIEARKASKVQLPTAPRVLLRSDGTRDSV